MKLFSIRVSGPITTGPRMVELITIAPAATQARPSIDDDSSTLPSIAGSTCSSRSRLASSNGVSFRCRSTNR